MNLARDRRSLPVQLRDELRDLIEQKPLQAGDQLPTEADIASRFGVGRTTVREALKLLEQDGVISVRHGRGRFVMAASALQRPLTRLESVTEMMASLGYSVTNRVLDIREIPAAGEVAEALRIVEGTPVLRLERLRLQGDEPLIYSVDVVRRDAIRVPLGSIDWTGSLLGLLETGGCAVSTAQAQIRSAHVPRDVARAMRRDTSESWLLMIQVHLTATGQPVLFSHDYHRGDKFTFHVLRRRDS